MGGVARFGLHRGLLFEDIVRNDPDYVTWACRCPNPCEAMKELLRWYREGYGDSLENVANFGIHRGRSYQDIVDTDPGYCQWARSRQDPSSSLQHFVDWLERREREMEALRDPHPWAVAQARPAAELSHVEFSPLVSQLQRRDPEAAGALEHFSAVACSSGLLVDYPDGCPVCLESFRVRVSVRTPCSHVFHRHCLAGCLIMSRQCPICRRDVVAVGRDRSRSPRRTVATDDSSSEAESTSESETSSEQELARWSTWEVHALAALHAAGGRLHHLRFCRRVVRRYMRATRTEHNFDYLSTVLMSCVPVPYTSRTTPFVSLP